VVEILSLGLKGERRLVKWVCDCVAGNSSQTLVKSLELIPTNPCHLLLKALV